jgi:hypothetical protein
MSQGSKPRDVLMTFEEWQDEEAARKAADAVIHPKVAPSPTVPSGGLVAPPDFMDPEGGADPDFDR